MVQCDQEGKDSAGIVIKQIVICTRLPSCQGQPSEGQRGGGGQGSRVDKCQEIVKCCKQGLGVEEEMFEEVVM